MTSTTTQLPPLPVWLDVEAGEMETERQFRNAACLLSGTYVVAANPIYVPLRPTLYVVPTDTNCQDDPHACIARWAGEDAERWSKIDFELYALAETEFSKVLKDTMSDVIATTHAIINATPTQLYRALVNVAWDDWREEYNKRREAVGGEG